MEEAIANMNDAADTNTDCMATGAYGTDDTITIPEGTVLYGSSPEQVVVDLTVNGAGVGKSVIDAAGTSIGLNTQADLTVSGVTISHFASQGIYVPNGNLTLSNVEIDGSTAVVSAGALFGVQALSEDGETHSHSLTDVYIHDMSGAANTGAVVGLFFGVTQSSVVDINLNRVTIAHITNTSVSGTNSGGVTVVTGITDGSYTPATVTLNADNVTVYDMNAASGAAGAVAGLGAVSGGEATIALNLRNSTLTHFRGATNASFGNTPTSAVDVIGAAVGADDVVSVSAQLTNVIVADSVNTQTSALKNCDISDISSLIGVGAASLSISSLGSNLSDDTSCSSYFTQPSDQNNLTSLSSTLGTFGYHGGYVPTIPLLAGSPAIDAGQTIQAITTDARGVTRPQGQAYDSGAYEYVPTATLAGTGEAISTLTILGSVMMLLGALLFFQRRYSVLQ